MKKIIYLMISFLLIGILFVTAYNGMEQSQGISEESHRISGESSITILKEKYKEEGMELISEEVKDILEERIEVQKAQKHRFIIEIEPQYQPLFEYKLINEIKTEEHVFQIIEIDVNKIKDLAQDKYILKFADESGMEGMVEYAKNELKKEFMEKVRKERLDRTVIGIPDFVKAKEIVEEEIEREIIEEEIEKDIAKISSFQYFVTPNDVKSFVSSKTKKQLYEYIAKTYWVSDEVLNGVTEKWLKPKTHLTETMGMETNPTNKIASDCSEQANTLVSLLRASGVPSSKVRVVLGKVQFGDKISGHAWVEIIEDGKWMVLEPTSGPYYADGYVTVREPLPYDYFKYHEFPVVEVLYYYNDKYFTEVDGLNNAPISWASAYETQIAFDSVSKDTKPSNTIWYVIIGIIIVLLYFQEKKKR